MTFKSAAGAVCYVSDLQRTIDFYERVGFVFKTKDATHAVALVNWWWIDFRQVDQGVILPAHDASDELGGHGPLLYFSVDNVAQAHAELLSRGVQPLAEPAQLGDNSEFVVRDPDGYRLVLFKRRR